MKIASITTSPMPTSTAHSIQAIKVTQALAQTSGGEVCLWTPGSRQMDWATMADNYGLSTPFRIEWLPARPPWQRYDFASAAIQAARQWGADMIYTWTIQAALMATWYSIPVIQEMHDVPMGHMGPLLFRLVTKSRSPHRILCTTQALRARLEDQIRRPLPKNEVLIAPNGTDMGRYQNLPDAVHARSLLQLPEKFTVVYSGHFYPGRGMDLLLDLARAFPQVSFLWIGGKPQDVEPWRIRLQQDKMENVTLTGFIENSRLPMYQAAADVLVMPYHQAVSDSGGGNIVDVFNPMKMFDYLAAGRPILSSDLPVLHEVLNTRNAMFAQPGDSADWVNALTRLIEDPGRRQRLSTQALQDAPQYDWRVRAKKALSNFP